MREQRRPGCWIGPIPGTKQLLGVPKVDMFRFTDSNCHDIFPATEPLGAVLPKRLAAAIGSVEKPFTFELLQTHDLTAGRALYAAALRDILVLPRTDIAQACRLSTVQETRRAYNRGRLLWSRVPSFPWWYFDERDGKPPSGWHDPWDAKTLRRLPGVSVLDAALLTWATGLLFPPGRHRPVGGWDSKDRPFLRLVR